MRAIDFFKTSFRDHRVAALLPSSRYVVRRIVRHIPPRVRGVVEYGAGDGVITREILRILDADAKIAAIEILDEFVRELAQISDPRLSVIQDDVIRVCSRPDALGLSRIDAVVSGIPFSYLASTTRREVVRRTHHFLAPGGVFIVYQHSLLMLPLLKQVFPRVEWYFEPRNLPPHFTMVAHKR